MDFLESGSSCKQSVVPLISGLPDDIALFCLARVPRKYHTVLNCFSRRWRDLLHSEEWCAYRRKHYLDETWIYALCRDNKLEHVCCYVLDPNLARRSWKMIHSLPTARCYFACEVLNQKIYSIGGLGDTHSWKSHTDPNIFTEIEDSFVMDEKIYIRCSTSAATSNALVYEPSTGTWQHVDANMTLGWQDPAVVVDGALYVLDQSSGTKLMMWQKESRVATRREAVAATYETSLPAFCHWKNHFCNRKGLQHSGN